MKYKIYGCRVNKYYLNRWMNYLTQQWKDQEMNYIVSSCVVTDRAKSKWLKDIQKHISQGYFVYLTGCGVFDRGNLMSDEQFYGIYPQLLPFQKSIHLLGEDAPIQDCNLMVDEWNIFTRKFLVVQNGCDSMCTYCLSVVKRWPSRDVEISQIISQINSFVSNGWKEIILTWINLAAWWSKNTNDAWSSQFSMLLETILRDTQVSRIRLWSLGPEFLDARFFAAVSSGRFMPHFHFSIQSFSDNVLKKMWRNYDSKVLENVLTKIKNLPRPDKDLISIWSDLIVGFPWETDADAQDTLDRVAKYKINKLHVFPFSAHTKHETVIASKFPNQIDQNTKKQREAKLLELGAQIEKDFANFNVWVKHKILIETKKWDECFWWTPNYIQWKVVGDYKRWDLVDIIYTNE